MQFFKLKYISFDFWGGSLSSSYIYECGKEMTYFHEGDTNYIKTTCFRDSHSKNLRPGYWHINAGISGIMASAMGDGNGRRWMEISPIGTRYLGWREAGLVGVLLSRRELHHYLSSTNISQGEK